MKLRKSLPTVCLVHGTSVVPTNPVTIAVPYNLPLSEDHVTSSGHGPRGRWGIPQDTAGWSEGTELMDRFLHNTVGIYRFYSIEWWSAS